MATAQSQPPPPANLFNAETAPPPPPSTTTTTTAPTTAPTDAPPTAGMSSYPGPFSPVGQRHPNGNGRGRFDAARSPPSSKSTAHVPCKFFRQGVCQAGKACPFLHSTEPATDTAPCKYFQKGNCKFGAKCALAHILPDGRTVNRPNLQMARHPFGRLPMHHPPGPAPTSSLLTMQAMAGPDSAPPYPYPTDDPYRQKDLYDMIPTIDTTFSSHPGSAYGSPPNDSKLPLSPIQKGLSVMDAPLPASFDSQGISHIARYGAIAASVPSHFGLESSPPSSYQNKATESAALRNLHSSAFGDDVRVRNGLGSSPPAAEEPFGGRRILHSERYARPRMPMSASLGARTPVGPDDWDEENFAFEEDLVPNSLHELLTPQEKMRRFSRAGDEDHGFNNHRHSLSGLGTPGDSKVGSPLASSPSRFGALFSRTHKPAEDISSSPGASMFGHVGSPLRNSSLNPNASPSLRPIGDALGGGARRTPSGDVSPFLASPPRQASMSMISQQLQRTRLSSRVEPGVGGRPGLSAMDRAVSSNSVSRERIDEEQEQGLFDMEEEDGSNLGGSGTTGSSAIATERKNKRLSGGTGSTTPLVGSPLGSSSVWGGFGSLGGLGAVPPSSSSPGPNLGLGGAASASAAPGAPVRDSAGPGSGAWGTS